jgi:hypothetical protein
VQLPPDSSFIGASRNKSYQFHLFVAFTPQTWRSSKILNTLSFCSKALTLDFHIRLYTGLYNSSRWHALFIPRYLGGYKAIRRRLELALEISFEMYDNQELISTMSYRARSNSNPQTWQGTTCFSYQLSSRKL